MSTTAPVPTTAATTSAVSTAAVLRRAAAAEWTRLITLRSTWWCLLAAAAIMLLIGAGMGAEHEGAEPAPVWLPAQIAIVPAQLAFLLAVLLAVTGEHATGAIRSTLQWLPRRGLLFTVRTLVPAAFAAGAAAALAGVAAIVAWALVGPAAEVVAADIAASLARVGLIVAFGSVLAIGIGLTLRSTAGALTAILLLLVVLPIALGNTGVPWLVAVSDALPGRAIVSLVVVDEEELTTAATATVMTSWTVAALAAGAWSLLRRDST